MTKTWDDYMNDPRVKNESMGLRITHAMRFKVQDDIEGMSTAEEVAYFNEMGRATLLRLGITPEHLTLHDENT